MPEHIQIKGRDIPEHRDPHNNYLPLPPEVTLNTIGSIHGIGLFSKAFVPPFRILGIARYRAPEGQEPIRTPLGGFINHSDTPNCVIMTDPVVGYPADAELLMTITPVQPGEELTLSYTLCNVKEPK